MKVHVLILLAAGFMLAADDKQEKADKDKLHGTWQAVSGQRDGRPDDKVKEHHLTLSGEGFSIKEGDKVVLKGMFKVDATKKPKALDFTIDEGPEALKGKTALGIYELNGDDLKWCAAEPGSSERPTEFAAKAGTRHLLVVFKREKP
jgi:uncharacterized protein (TIGR03067 family)